MVWCAGWEAASTVSNAGGLGIIGAGSMYPEILRDQIAKCKEATDKPFAVNVPLLYPAVEEHMQSIIDLEVPILFTSAGTPKKWTKHLQSHGIKVVHVVSSAVFAAKSEAAGVDAVVAEGFEAGGHNGREETTTMCLIPSVVDAVEIPVIAAGGLYDGKSMLAAMVLGMKEPKWVLASLPQKNRLLQCLQGCLCRRRSNYTHAERARSCKDDAQRSFQRLDEAKQSGASPEELAEILGRGRAKKGMFEGDLIGVDLR